MMEKCLPPGIGLLEARQTDMPWDAPGQEKIYFVIFTNFHPNKSDIQSVTEENNKIH